MGKQCDMCRGRRLACQGQHGAHHTPNTRMADAAATPFSWGGAWGTRGNPAMPTRRALAQSNAHMTLKEHHPQYAQHERRGCSPKEQDSFLFFILVVRRFKQYECINVDFNLLKRALDLFKCTRNNNSTHILQRPCFFFFSLKYSDHEFYALLDTLRKAAKKVILF